ncbi:MAG TPA: glycosyltransferase family 4 protein [Gillisia sp.]|nr:glycosyltransferase family 4 protein [Gillisia sp.]
MNILHLSAVKNWGGGENHLENLCNGLNEEYGQIKNIILCNANGEFRGKLEKTNLNFVPAPLSFKMDPRFIFKIRSICKKEKIDLIHIHDTTALALGVMAGHLFSLPNFIFSKKTSFPIKARKQTLYKYNYHKIKKILCVSRATADITSPSIKNREKLEVIYHGTNTKALENVASLNLRKKLNLSPDTLIIGNIANHIRAKDLNTFVRTAAEIIKLNAVKKIHFVQIGSFTNRTSAILKLTRELDLEKHISYLGFYKDAAGLIPQFDISLMTSQSEGLPQFILESLFHRVPVVSTNVGGISEVIENEKNGLLAPVHDHKTLSLQLLRLIDEPELRKKYTQTSRETIEGQFTSQAMVLKTLEIYKQVIYGSA